MCYDNIAAWAKAGPAACAKRHFSNIRPETTAGRPDHMQDYFNTVRDISFHDLEAEDVVRLSHMFHLRPNKSCDSGPLCNYLYKDYYNVRFCSLDDGRALLLQFVGPDGGCFGFPPHCREEDLPHYFRLQEQYYNEVLGIPLVIYSADEEAVTYLQAAGALDAYEVQESEDLKDYLYDGDALRTLAGRKYSKKRNHLHKFEEAWSGRCEYRRITPDDVDAVTAFLRRWMNEKESKGAGTGIGEDAQSFDTMEELEGEYRGIYKIISTPLLFEYVRVGGIFIDGELKAFSLGDWNPCEEMAIINVEKADAEITGLYQAINQQFLLHEYPDAKLVNREDDVGIEGLRQSKLSYYPIGTKENIL